MVDNFLQRFDGVVPEGDHYKTTCPACGKPKHLYITPTKDKSGNDTVKIYCQKCGANAQQIAEALNISLAELLHGEDVKSLPTNQVHTEQRGHIYHNADGSVFGRKTIKKDGTGKKNCYWELYSNGKWLNGLQQQEAPLYLADNLSAHPTKSLIVVEGEKDADTLTAMGILSTSMPNGASQKKWPDSYTAAFAGRDVVIITDNDPPGTQYGEFVAQHIHGVAASVKVIPATAIWADVKPKGDISDIIAALGADDALNRLQGAMARTAAYQKQSILDKLGFFTVPDLTEADKRPPEFVVDGMIPTGMTFISGAPKTRKSFLALQLAAAVANGVPFLGHSTKRCKVCYFDLEGSKSRISARVSRMGLQFSRDILITNTVDTKIADGLCDMIREIHNADDAFKLFIVDTYSRARGSVKSSGANAYDADVQLLEPIQRMAIDEGIALVFIHHDKKGAGFAQDSFERLSGTMGISGSCDAVINLITEGKRFDGKAKLEYTPRDAKGGEIAMTFNDVTLEWYVDVEPNGIIGNPLIKWCIDNAPSAQKEGVFVRYDDLHRVAYNVSVNDPSERIRSTLSTNRDALFKDYGISFQLGVKSSGYRGVRLFRCF